MRFNPHAFKRANSPDAASASVVTDAVDAISGPDAVSAFIAAYGRPGANQVNIPEGSLAVTLSLKFNDSAPQVDHFDYHAPTGCPAFLILLVKKQGAKARFAQTENLARKALALCPELQALDWHWKSEKYGGGHGNYLISSPIELPAAIREVLTVRTTFGGQPVTRAFWEIQFANVWRGSPLQLWPHKHYGDPVVESPFSNGRQDDTGGNSGCNAVTAAWRLNERLRGVEIHFTRRPDDATLAPLRADRAWRYTGKSKCWYARQTDATVAWAKAFCENFNGGLSSSSSSSPSVVPSSVVSSPILPRPERKIIRFTDTGHEGIGSSRGIVRELNPAMGTWTPVPAAELAAEREVLQREYLNSQGRADFYEANPAPSGALINVADLMRPKV